MTHEIQPSRFGAGTTYGKNGEHIVPPASYEVQGDTLFTDKPRIARVSGAIAVENSGIGTIPLGPGFLAEVSRRAKVQSDAQTEPNRVPEKHELLPNSYKSPNERQQALDIAEVRNKMNAAKAAGMTVDQWSASRNKNR